MFAGEMDATFGSRHVRTVGSHLRGTKPLESAFGPKILVPGFRSAAFEIFPRVGEDGFHFIGYAFDPPVYRQRRNATRHAAGHAGGEDAAPARLVGGWLPYSDWPVAKREAVEPVRLPESAVFLEQDFGGGKIVGALNGLDFFVRKDW